MKKIVINLKSRSDRKFRFNREVAPKLGEVEWLPAIDGSTTDFSVAVRTVRFKSDSSWRDPFQERPITKGEMGCFASHYLAWQKCYQLGEPVLILEDDVEFDWNLWDEKHIEETMAHNKGDISLLLLGYNENEPENVIKHPDYEDVIIPAYPYNAHAYVLSPQAAQWMINCEINKEVIPVDEFISDMRRKYGKNVRAMEQTIVRQVPRSELGSNIEPYSDQDWHIDFKMHAVTVGTDERKCKSLMTSATQNGFTVKNLGLGEKWTGGNMEQGPGGGMKLRLLRDFLMTVKPDDVVLFTDAYDVFYTGDIESITRRFLDTGKDIIFAAENQIWPDQDMAKHFPDTITEYKYLNSGTFIGIAKKILEILNPEVDDDYDDQLYYQQRYLQMPVNGQRWENHSVNIGLDVEQYIFTTYDPENYVQNGQVYNPKTRCYGLVYHGNGGPDAKSDFKAKYNTIYPPQAGLYIPAMGKFDLLDTDMLLVDFMTQDQCERLIEIADNHGDWAPLPGDKFPAYEIRMKELGLWEELQKHWEEQIYPICEKHWWPMQMYGLRDAFVMRYSVDTQKSLPMHNDASLVTGSVKLNDNYKGASLNFPRQNINNDDIPVGKCILFPGMVTHGHECTTLEEGVKYSFTMWSSRYVGDEN